MIIQAQVVVYELSLGYKNLEVCVHLHTSDL